MIIGNREEGSNERAQGDNRPIEMEMGNTNQRDGHVVGVLGDRGLSIEQRQGERILRG